MRRLFNVIDRYYSIYSIYVHYVDVRGVSVCVLLDHLMSFNDSYEKLIVSRVVLDHNKFICHVYLLNEVEQCSSTD